MTSFSSKQIANLKPREKRYTVAIGDGLSVKVQPTGTKSFVLRISKDGKVRDIHIGHFPDCTLSQAKQITRRKRKEALLSAPDGYTLRDAFKLWCGLKRGRIVSYQDERRRLEQYLIGPIGSRQLDEITAPLVIHTVKGLDKSGKRATLKRVLMRTREILDLAVCAGFIETREETCDFSRGRNRA